MLVEADVVIAGTAATESVITVERFRPLLKKRRHRPIFLIDLAMPRDIEPAVGGLPNVYLYNLDDLNAALAESPGRREKIEHCETLVRQAAHRCLESVQHQDVGVLVRQLRGKLQDIGDEERHRTQRKLSALGLNGQQEQVERLLDEHTHRLLNKVLHLPLQQLNARGESDPADDAAGISLGFYAAALRRLFDLSEESPPHEPRP